MTEFEVLSATYTAITVRSRTGIPETVDTPKDLTVSLATQHALKFQQFYYYEITKIYQ